MNEGIHIGDYVTLVSNPFLNGGLQMSVVGTTDSHVQIGYFDSTGTHKEEWFPIEDIKIVQKAQGGFLDLGEAP